MLRDEGRKEATVGEPHPMAKEGLKQQKEASVNVLEWQPPENAPAEAVKEWKAAVKAVHDLLGTMKTGGGALESLLTKKKGDLSQLREKLFHVKK